ncbi:MAG: nitroreductase family protein [Desulfobacterales bacterium]|nr:MAG: nitroreductase family protein [Desulfobacterales bacterium]
MKNVTIDLEKCNKDAICVMACPTRVIQMASPDDVPSPTLDFEDYCLKCGHCTAVCPTGAFSLDWLSPDQCPPIHKELALSEQQTEQFLRVRRSIRNFKDKAVERQKLEKLLEIACYAPSAKNSQPWHWTVVQEPAETRRLAGMVIDWMRTVIKQYPKQAELRGLPRVVAAWDGGQERICRGAPHIIVVHGDKTYGFGAEDGALALSYLELYAPAIGLGSCWGGYFYSAVNAYPPLFEALGLPADHRAFGAVMVGYRKLKYQRLPLRNAPRVNWR